jgi:hypothetical protein
MLRARVGADRQVLVQVVVSAGRADDSGPVAPAASEEVLVVTRTRIRRPEWSAAGDRRAARRRLRRIDALSAQLGQLHVIRGVLEHASEVVGTGGVQGAWFTVDVGGRTRAVTATGVGLAAVHPVTGACLVGAVVQAGGGPGAVRSQPVQRALDLVWHTLREDAAQPVRWCPGPPARALHVLDLTRAEVLELLRASAAAVDVQQEMCRAERAELTPTSGTGGTQFQGAGTARRARAGRERAARGRTVPACLSNECDENTEEHPWSQRTISPSRGTR